MLVILEHAHRPAGCRVAAEFAKRAQFGDGRFLELRRLERSFALDVEAEGIPL